MIYGDCAITSSRGIIFKYFSVRYDIMSQKLRITKTEWTILGLEILVLGAVVALISKQCACGQVSASAAGRTYIPNPLWQQVLHQG